MESEDLKRVLIFRFAGARFVASLPLVSLLLVRSVGSQRMHLISVYFGIRTKEIGKVELRMGNISHRIRKAYARALGTLIKCRVFL